MAGDSKARDGGLEESSGKRGGGPDSEVQAGAGAGQRGHHQ